MALAGGRPGVRRWRWHRAAVCRRRRRRQPRRRGIGAVAVARDALLVALAARSLEEPRGGEPEHESSGHDRPRLPAGEVLDVAQDAVGVRLGQVAAYPFGPLGGLLRHAGRCVLALLAKLLADAAKVSGRGRDLLAGLGGALVDLLADAALRLAGRLLGLVLGLARYLLGPFRGLRGGIRHACPPLNASGCSEAVPGAYPCKRCGHPNGAECKTKWVSWRG